MAKLTFILDDGETIEVPLHDSVTIGRADGNDVVVYDPRISSRHAELHFLSDGKFEVRDLASKAGTYVNGERVERKLLGHGDQVNFGPLKGEFSTDVVQVAAAVLESPQAEEEEEEENAEEAEEVVVAPSARQPEGGKPNVPPKEKSDKGFLSSVLAAMGAKSANGEGKPAEPKAGKQERRQDAAAPVAKAKADERPAQPKAKAAGVSPESAKAPEAKPAEAKAVPAKQPPAKAPVSPTSTSSPGKSTNAPVVAAPQPQEVKSGAVAAAAPAPAVPLRLGAPAVVSESPAPPASAVVTPVPALAPASPKPEKPKASESKTPAADAPPEAGKPVAWDKNVRREGKPEQEAPARPKPAAEPSALSPKRAKPEAGIASATPQDPPVLALPASTVPPIPLAPPAPEGTVQAAPAPVLLDAKPVIEVAAEENMDLVMPKPAALAPSTPSTPAPSKSTTPVVVAAVPALDQRMVQLVYNRLEGEAKAAITSLEGRQKSLDAEVTRLRDEIIRLQAERRDLAQHQSDLRGAIQTETVDLEALRTRHKTAEEQMHQLVSSLTKGQERLAKLEAEEKQLAHVTSQLAETEARRDQVRNAIEELAAQGEARRDQINKAIEELAAHGEARRDQVNKAIEELTAQAEAKRTKLQGEIEKLSVELEAKRADFQDAMESMTQQAETARTDLQAGIDAAAADADAQRLQIQTEMDQLTAETAARRAELLGSIDALAKEEEFRQGELQRLMNSCQTALREFEAMTSNKEQMGVQLLSLLKEQETHDARLIELRRQIADAEGQAKKVQELVEARGDQVKSSERRLQSIEQQRNTLERSIRELTESENRLKALLPKLEQSEARSAELTTAIATLLVKQQESEAHNESLAAHTLQLQEELAAFEAKSAETQALVSASISELQQNKLLHTEEYERFVAETNAAMASLTEQRIAAEEELAKRQAELARETASLQETIAQREELERQCKELADTDKRLMEAKAGVQKTEAQRQELDAWIKELQSKRDASQKSLDALHHEEEASRGRLEVLRGKEKDLRSELEQLGQKEQEDRTRFEELRRLTSEADREHAGHMEELARTLELTRRELADMEVKLAPLREWKESMDKRYARLASLPEDSAEARELWKEIEAEKAGLSHLIGVSGKGTRGVSLNESVLRGMSSPGEDVSSSEAASASEPPTPRGGLKGRGKSKLHAPPGRTDAETPEERGNVGPSGTGAMLSGTGQEMALRARLSRLRESVQREATRLEFLRQERAREETRKTGSTSNEPMLKEQERQVEVKLRREEEKLATIERKIEIAEMEEEKRRERLAELERKLTELKTDILEHERSRSEAVRKSDIALVEAKVAEDMAGRARSGAENEPLRSDRPSSASPLEARPKLKTMGVPAPAPEPIDVPDSEKGMGELLLGRKPE